MSSPSTFSRSSQPCVASEQRGTHSSVGVPSLHVTPSWVASDAPSAAWQSVTVVANEAAVSASKVLSQASKKGRKTAAQSLLHVSGWPSAQSSPASSQHSSCTALARHRSASAGQSPGESCARRWPAAHSSRWHCSNALSAAAAGRGGPRGPAPVCAGRAARRLGPPAAPRASQSAAVVLRRTGVAAVVPHAGTQTEAPVAPPWASRHRFFPLLPQTKATDLQVAPHFQSNKMRSKNERRKTGAHDRRRSLRLDPDGNRRSFGG